MRYHFPVQQGKLIIRRNRFVAEVLLDDRKITAVVPTTGRLKELLVPGADVRVLPAQNPNRLHRWDMAQVRKGRVWVSVNAVQANPLFGEAVDAGMVDDLRGWQTLRHEVPYGRSRFDWLLQNGKKLMYVEVKSVTLVENGIGYFPDAPTERGVKHLHELIEIAKGNDRAAIAFVAQRSDTLSVRANERTDPAFAVALADAARKGVQLIGLYCRVAAKGIQVVGNIPVEV